MHHSPRQLRVFATGLLLSAALALPGQLNAADDMQLSDMTLDDFLNMEVTSVSKKSQRRLETPSAVHVITSEDIRRSGHTSIPELLRLAPGIDVARQGSNVWAIGSRGGASQFTNNLLILIDGRSVYTPLFGGTYWDVQDLPLEDIDRIEVIRGSGGAIWGANAVSGVVNIIRKKPSDASGNFVSVAGGTADRAMGSFRVGQRVSDKLSLRWSGRYTNRDETDFNVTDSGSGDAWALGNSGLAMELETSDADTLTLQGDWYRGEIGTGYRLDNAGSVATGLGALLFEGDQRVHGGNATGRWEHQFSETSTASVQLYWDRRVRKQATIEEIRSTTDFEFQHQFRWGERQNFVWGGGARMMRDRIDNSFNIAFTPSSNEEMIYNAFAQDEIELTEDWTLTAGSKLEYNTYTDWEIQPTLRMTWTPADNHQLWAAASRTVRTPARAERELGLFLITVIPVLPGPVGVPVSVVGNSSVDSEKILSGEFGWRHQPSDRISLDLAYFYYNYDNIVGLNAVGGPFSFVYNNRNEAFVWGSELEGQWAVNDWLRLTGSWTGLKTEQSFGDSSPSHRFQAHSYMNLPGNVELDSALYYYGNRKMGFQEQRVGSFTRFDLRIGWKPIESVELSLVAQDLFGDEDVQARDLFADPRFGDREIPRAFYGKLTWAF